MTPEQETRNLLLIRKHIDLVLGSIGTTLDGPDLERMNRALSLTTRLLAAHEARHTPNACNGSTPPSVFPAEHSPLSPAATTGGALPAAGAAPR